MCQIDIFIHVQYCYFTTHHSNKLDKTAVFVIGDCNVHVSLTCRQNYRCIYIIIKIINNISKV
jgi:hypothetical protein